MLRACPHHGFMKLAQIDTFYNGLNDNDQDSLNVAAGGNLLSKTTREALQIIEKKSKGRYSRNKLNDSRMNTTSKENDSKTDDRIDKLADQISTLVNNFAKKVVTPTLCLCGAGTYNQVAPQNHASNYMAPPGFAKVQNSQNRFNQNQGQGNYFNQGNNFQPFQVPNKGFQSQPFHVPSNPVQQESILNFGTLSSNTIPNPKGEMKAITTRSGLAYKGPSFPTNPSPKKRLNDQQLREKATNQMEKFFQIFQDLHFDISFTDALLLMPKFASMIKSLLTNKDTLFELVKILLNENCSAMLVKKLLEKLGDLGKFLIPCDFPGMDVCHAMADLGAIVNLMPLSVKNSKIRIFLSGNNLHWQWELTLPVGTLTWQWECLDAINHLVVLESLQSCKSSKLDHLPYVNNSPLEACSRSLQGLDPSSEDIPFSTSMKISLSLAVT
nr:reverse transcriptase domain-containing protein [Tanacetum cinerariifolium]